jgi:hypothetical protein
VFRIKAIIGKNGVTLERTELQDAFDGDLAVERFFGTLKEDNRRLTFRV